MNYEAIIIGAAALGMIGIFHPIVIRCEYYFTSGVWPIFLVVGLAALTGALFTHGLCANLLAVFGSSALWSIIELKKQTKRVERGWFPKNPKRK